MGVQNLNRLQQQKVAILCANNVASDSRVRKIARSSLSLGFDPHIIGVSKNKKHEVTSFDGVKATLVDNSKYRFRHFAARSHGAFPYSLLSYKDKDRENLMALLLSAEKESLRRSKGSETSLFLSGVKYKYRALIYTVRRYASNAEYRAFVRPNRIRYFYQLLKFSMSKESKWAFYEPTLVDYSFLMLPILEDFAPDVIHANDTATILAAVAYKNKNPQTRIIYDMHEWVHGLPGLNLLKSKAYAAALDQNIFAFDEVLTVSNPLADLIFRRYSIRAKVIENLPWAADQTQTVRIRDILGLEEEVPLLVYSGWIAPERGLETVIRGLVKMSRVHLAVVSNQPHEVEKLEKFALALGVRARVHIMPYVEPSEIVSYLSGCTAGVIPLHRATNHEISRITKFFEYLNARIPIVTSDVKEMSESVLNLGVGEVFQAENVEAFVVATEKVIENIESYQVKITDELLDNLNWQSHHHQLIDIYENS